MEKMGKPMLIKDLEIKEYTHELRDNPKQILMNGEVVIESDGILVSIPVTMSYEYKDDKNYLKNYKESIEHYLLTCANVSQRWKPTGNEKRFEV